MSDSIDCIVVGAGVVGLAVARRLALSGYDVAVLDKEDRIGVHTSSRNSEVIHAGIYYPTGSLKARLCVDGKHALYDYCASKNVPHKRIGKLIVATRAAEETTLDKIRAQAAENGVADLVPLDRSQVRNLEPRVDAARALFSPSTGIVDSHEYMLALQGDLEAAGGSVVLKSPVTGVRKTREGFEVLIDGEPQAHCRLFVNSAGLWAPDLAAAFEGTPALAPKESYLARGHYFAYSGASPFTHLIYPVPIDGGLGIHSTNDMAGQARFGPDVQWIDEVDYSFPSGLRGRFVESVRRYFPDIDPDRMTESYTGIRPKLSGSGVPPADFGIYGPGHHGVPGLVNLFGMESPALTSSLAVANHVAGLIADH